MKNARMTATFKLYGFKSERAASSHEDRKPLESDLYEFVRKIEFENRVKQIVDSRMFL